LAKIENKVYDCAYKDFDKDSFIEILHNHKQAFKKGVVNSNLNGYQSPANLHKLSQLNSFFTFVENQTKHKIVCAWANFNEGTNQNNIPHIHEGMMSGVFYVNVPKGSGALNILDKKIIPQEGILLYWPSNLLHSVDNNTLDVERISISFNLN